MPCTEASREAGPAGCGAVASKYGELRYFVTRCRSREDFVSRAVWPCDLYLVDSHPFSVFGMLGTRYVYLNWATSPKSYGTTRFCHLGT